MLRGLQCHIYIYKLWDSLSRWPLCPGPTWLSQLLGAATGDCKWLSPCCCLSLNSNLHPNIVAHSCHGLGMCQYSYKIKARNQTQLSVQWFPRQNTLSILQFLLQVYRGTKSASIFYSWNWLYRSCDWWNPWTKAGIVHFSLKSPNPA